MRSRLGVVGFFALVLTSAGCHDGNGGNRTGSAGTDTTAPTIAATADPPPNAAGWNDTNVTVSFSCADAGSGVATCASPVTLTTDGAGQSVTGTATDKAGNSAQTTATLNIDQTPPNVTVTAPSAGAVLTSSAAAISGTVTDALSGIDAVRCNGTAAVVTAPNFTCNVTLANGSNTLTVQVTDRAGNVQTATLSVTYSAGASYTVGGAIVGLTGSGLVLQNNVGDDLSIASSETSFAFATALASGAHYAVSVLTQPTNPSQSCLVSNGSGSVGTSNVSDVVVTCGSLASLPKTRELIAQALADGRIDYATSLEYRLWALFMDPRLPLEFEGPDLGTEDTALFFEIHQGWDTLSPSAQATIQPYLLRPTDPGSLFSGGSMQTATAALRAAAQAVPCPSWNYANGATAYVTVWVCYSGNIAADLEIRARVIEILDRQWPAMTADTGEPRHDDGAGGDDRIDVYVVPIASCIPRNGTCEGISIPDNGREPADAVAPPWPAAAGSPGGTSGYELVRWDRAAAGGTSFESDVVHEFYHVLQFAHIDYNGGAWRSWFIEASAKWAEWAYVPGASATEVHTWYPAAYTDTHDTVFDETSYQPGNMSLLVRGNQHEYASYIWPYFMQQEAGGGSAVVGNAWKSADFASDAATIDRAIDRQLAFADDFGDFIVRNLNYVLPGDPLQTHFWDLDPNFPSGLTDAHPVINRSDLYQRAELTNGMQRVSFPFEVQNLSAIYQAFTVPATSGIGHVLFESEPDNGTNLPDVEAVAGVVNSDGTLTYKRFTATDHRRLEFCFANPEQNVAKIYLALGNHDFSRSGTDAIPTMTGTLYITTDNNCGEWTGTLTYTLKNLYRQETTDELGTAVDQTHEITTHTWSIGSVKPDPDYPIFQQLTLGWTVNDAVNDTYDLSPNVPCGGNTLHSSTSGSHSFGASVNYDLYPGPNGVISIGAPYGTTPPASPTSDWTPGYESVSCDGDVVTADGAPRTLSDQNGAALSLYGPPGGFPPDADDPNHYKGVNTVTIAPNVTATVTWDMYHHAAQ